MSEFLAPEHIDLLREALALIDRVIEAVPDATTDGLEDLRNELSVQIDHLDGDVHA